MSASLRVNSLSFTYPGESRFAIQELSFDLLPGQHIAIVGPSGSGKTTLLNILLRFWDFDRGEILLDGVDLRRHNLEGARQHFAVVSQHTYLFNTSLEENLRLANPNATALQMQLALDQAQLKEFIHSLPEGLGTLSGEHGLSLSAGQRQRLAIARAMLQPNCNGKLPILLLDEPTSSLDTIAEKEILDTICKLSEERSIMLVTHNLRGLENFDEIFVVVDGRITEHGSHNMLLKHGGWYAKNYYRSTRKL